MDKGDINFILGLFAGEGCFCISWRKKSTNRLGVGIDPYAFIVMNDDRDLINKVNEILPVGDIYEYNYDDERA